VLAQGPSAPEVEPYRKYKQGQSLYHHEKLGELGTQMLKALVWFWIIDETLVLTSILSVCRLNEVGTCQVMEQVIIMVMRVMTTR